VLVAKLTEGAWIAVLLIASMVILLQRVKAHHELVARLTVSSPSLGLAAPPPPIAVVPLRRWDAVSLKALRFAMGMSSKVIAVQVLTEDRGGDELTRRWPELVERPAHALGLEPPALVVLRSEYRSLFAPLLD